MSTRYHHLPSFNFQLEIQAHLLTISIAQQILTNFPDGPGLIDLFEFDTLTSTWISNPAGLSLRHIGYGLHQEDATHRESSHDTVRQNEECPCSGNYDQDLLHSTHVFNARDIPPMCVCNACGKQSASGHSGWQHPGVSTSVCSSRQIICLE